MNAAYHIMAYTMEHMFQKNRSAYAKAVNVGSSDLRRAMDAVKVGSGSQSFNRTIELYAERRTGIDLILLDYAPNTLAVLSDDEKCQNENIIQGARSYFFSQATVSPHDERIFRMYFLVHDVINQLEAVMCGRNPEHYFGCRAYKRNDDDESIDMKKKRCPCAAFRMFADVFFASLISPKNRGGGTHFD